MLLRFAGQRYCLDRLLRCDTVHRVLNPCYNLPLCLFLSLFLFVDFFRSYLSLSLKTSLLVRSSRFLGDRPVWRRRAGLSEDKKDNVEFLMVAMLASIPQMDPVRSIPRNSDVLSRHPSAEDLDAAQQLISSATAGREHQVDRSWEDSQNGRPFDTTENVKYETASVGTADKSSSSPKDRKSVV